MQRAARKEIQNIIYWNRCSCRFQVVEDRRIEICRLDIDWILSQESETVKAGASTVCRNYGASGSEPQGWGFFSPGSFGRCWWKNYPQRWGHFLWCPSSGWSFRSSTGKNRCCHGSAGTWRRLFSWPGASTNSTAWNGFESVCVSSITSVITFHLHYNVIKDKKNDLAPLLRAPVQPTAPPRALHGGIEINHM